MAVFIGSDKNTRAVKAASAIEWAVKYVLQPRLKAKWPAMSWQMKQGIGIDTGTAYLVNGGVRGDNDIISIGSAPNVAAKLSENRSASIFMTKAVFNRLHPEIKYKLDGTTCPWTYMGKIQYGSMDFEYYSGSYGREP